MPRGRGLPLQRRKPRHRIWIEATISALVSGLCLWAQEKETDRLNECGKVMKEILVFLRASLKTCWIKRSA